MSPIFRETFTLLLYQTMRKNAVWGKKLNNIPQQVKNNSWSKGLSFKIQLPEKVPYNNLIRCRQKGKSYSPFYIPCIM